MSVVGHSLERRRERESQILRVARRMLLERGYLGMNMDRIAEEMRYSKGTMYQHFSCKEEILMALAVETLEKRVSLFERAATWSGASRERMTAVGAAMETFVRSYPDYFHVERILQTASIWEKTSEQRRNRMRMNEFRCMGIVAGIVRDGVARGELELPTDVAPEELVFGLWSMTFGGYAIIAAHGRLEELGVREPFQALRKNLVLLLDGYGWQPLSAALDYSALFDRIGREWIAPFARASEESAADGE